MENEKFRADFPDFNDQEKFPDSQVTFWGELAELSVSTCRFGPVRPYAVEIFAAHLLATAAMNAAGAIPGTGGALVASKKVGDVSISYDNSGVTGDVNALWSGTRYGKMWLDLARIYGAGAVQL